MRLVRLEAHDFAQHADLDLDLGRLHERGIAQAVIVGPNGSGKSTMLDAVVWCLFGRGTDRSESTDALIRYDRLGMWVRTTWDRDGQTVVIRRDRSIETKAGESMLSLSVDGQSRKQHTIGETQAEIQALTGLDREQLLAGPLMEQGESDKLMRLNPAPRKQLFSALCGNERFVPWYERAKEMRVEAVARCLEIDARIPAVRERLDRELDVKRRLLDASAQEASAQDEMDRLSREMTALTEEAQDLRDKALRAEHLTERLAILNRDDEKLLADRDTAEQALERWTNAAAVPVGPLDEQPEPAPIAADRLADLDRAAEEVDASRRALANWEASLEHQRAAHAKAEAEGLCDRCPYRGVEMTAEAQEEISRRIATTRAWLDEHEHAAVDAVALRASVAARDREIELVRRSNAERRLAFDRAVAERTVAEAEVRRYDELIATIDDRRKEIAHEAAERQAERLRLIQTQDRALEVVDELRDRTERYEVAKRLWVTASGNRRVAEEQMVDVDLARSELRALNVQYVEATRDRDDLQMVEAMFHRDGLPTLLLELTIPLVEARANELLLRMPGELNVALVTQKATKKGTLSETLDVAVTKRGRPLAYGMASGAERFRIDLALRLGLAGVLLHRTGAQFSTLWLDEPFAAQDAEALEALLQSVAAVVDEFGFTFVTTHQREVAERFPVRIEVGEGAMQMAKVRVVA